MAVASNYLIGGNDEHGINPPTLGKRTPIMPYINRPIYENEFNYMAKNYFLIACLRCGFNVFDVKPEQRDISISSRVVRVNRANLNALVTFAYNAYLTTFNSSSGYQVFYSPTNSQVVKSRALSYDVYDSLSENTTQRGRGVTTLDVGMLSSVNCPATLIEAGFMTNFQEAKNMLDPDYQKKIGEDACRGVCEFLDVNYVLPYSTTTSLQVLKQGDRGNKVKYLQYLLLINGFSVGNIDGIFGAKTTEAVKKFQQQNGLAVDGIVGQNTYRYLLVLNPSSVVLKKGSKGSYVRYLQQKLLAKLYPLTVDNDFGNITENAVLNFQSENNLVADGIVGKNTWEKLILIGGGRPLNN